MRRARRLSCSLLVSAALLATACGGDGGDGGAEAAPSSTTAPAPAGTTVPTAAPTTAAPTTAAPTTAPPATAATAPPATATTAPVGCGLAPLAPGGATTLGTAKVRLERVAALDEPLAMALRAGDARLFVAEKRGRVRSLCAGKPAAEPVLDISGEVSLGGEQGLLGLAFAPAGDFMYVSLTDRDGDSRLWEYAFNGGKVAAGARREVLRLSQPYANHNGGQILFGPDGYLYVFFGDGGSGGDPERHGQDLGTWLGKILRIDPKAGPDGAAYTVPADNPFVGREGARPEIWAYGLRNPWRNAFDPVTGDLWIGDVGQSSTEEVDFQPKGAGGLNYGWSAYEGDSRFNQDQAEPASYAPPVVTYPTKDGCAVTGGHVYRGTAVPGLAGAYVFGDFCNGRLQALRLKDGKATERRDLGVTVDQLASFGESQTGDLFALSLAGALYRIAPG